MSVTPAEPRQAATVVLLRDGASGLEVLMLKRNKALLFAGGVWVFPGGAIEAEDRVAAGDDLAAAARRAAVREAHEESGLRVDADGLVPMSVWTTPEAEPRRFHTWFFLAVAPRAAAVTIDGSEIHEHAWVSVEAAIAGHMNGEWGMFPPTIVTLRALARFSQAAEAMQAMAARTPYTVLPIFSMQADEVLVFLPGDACYPAADPAGEDARHRCCLQGASWHYQFENVAPGIARLDE